jgi:hypothetical protein
MRFLDTARVRGRRPFSALTAILKADAENPRIVQSPLREARSG